MRLTFVHTYIISWDIFSLLLKMLMYIPHCENIKFICLIVIGKGHSKEKPVFIQEQIIVRSNKTSKQNIKV
ncbi:hypothetical protein Scep_021943 [Stephania cephalantha]|uniref:Uncharacterized protein n=1 Tax=Stephania cephalantha TaxID=152367 RepID=A0AAP0FFD5_9MAGN